LGAMGCRIAIFEDGSKWTGSKERLGPRGQAIADTKPWQPQPEEGIAT